MSLTHTKHTPAFIKQIQSRLTDQNKQKQVTEMQTYLAKNVDDDKERRKMLVDYMNSFEEQTNSLDPTGAASDVRDSVRRKQADGIEELKRLGFDVDGTAVASYGKDNRGSSKGDNEEGDKKQQEMYEVFVKDPIDVGKQIFLEKPKFVSKTKLLEPQETKTSKDSNKTDDSKDESTLGKRGIEQVSKSTSASTNDKQATKNKKLVNTNTLSFDD